MPSESGHPRATTATYPPPNLSEPLPCPRCNSTNTKFCYYNNYNLSQPRYFCKSCRRYWTHGGTLRDVPVGGGTRRSSSKRHRSFSTSASSSSSSVISTTNNETKQETVKTDEGVNVISGYESFESLLGEGAFLALGSGSVGLDYGFGFGYGLEEMNIGYSECFGATGGEIPVMDGCGDTWQIGEIEGKSGDSLILPGLEISMQGNNVK